MVAQERKKRDIVQESGVSYGVHIRIVEQRLYESAVGHMLKAREGNLDDEFCFLLQIMLQDRYVGSMNLESRPSVSDNTLAIRGIPTKSLAVSEPVLPRARYDLK